MNFLLERGYPDCDKSTNPFWIASSKLSSGENVFRTLLSIRKRLWTPYQACELVEAAMNSSLLAMVMSL